MAEVLRRVRPTPVDTYLANPHKGCCTFQHFNGDELFPGTSWSEEGPLVFSEPKHSPHHEGYLPTTVAYCRWFWRVLEPADGRLDFSMIDGALETCAKRGQTLAVRLMAFGSPKQPQVPDWYAAKCPMQDKHYKSSPQRVPVHDSPEYFERWGGLVRAFAQRYDGHPLLESIDVAFLGPWGEGAGQCGDEQIDRFAELWQEAFVHTPRLALIGGRQLTASLKRGSGWRCDCFGDLKQPGSPHVRKDLSNNHHYESYPKQICQAGAQEAWKTGPVHFETCWVPMYWYQNGFDLDFILQQGRKLHGTYFMPKYTHLPAPWMERLATFCRTLGYRFVLRHCSVTSPVTPEAPVKAEIWIENMGVAPLYRRYDFALRFRQGDYEQIVPLKDVDVRTWLPGDAWISRSLPLPPGIKPGWVDLAAGLLDPRTGQARVRFAVKEQFSDGWVDLNGFEVRG
ncbi:MAG: DUF4832 domain-containing protein [Planctomycetes bacterium]|nr:DUF4832 domain-containing protein [Planctomycetota bacterium]